MRTVYIDSECKCRLSGDGAVTEIQTDFFDGKCDAFVEGYRFIPAGESWTRSDGTAFRGEMIAPWMDYGELDKAQREFEQQLIAQYEDMINQLYEEVL